MSQDKIHIKYWGRIYFLNFILVLAPLSAQTLLSSSVSGSITFDHIGEEQDINSFINFIFEDHFGYLWFGAGPEGLYRFDGYEFEHYQHQVGDSSSLPHNIVATIFHEDRSGNLWLASGGAITRYNRLSNDFSILTDLKHSLPWFTWATINSVAEDMDGNIWLSSYGNPSKNHTGGLIRIDSKTGSTTLFRHDTTDSTSICSNCISSLLIDNEGNLWIGSCGAGVDRYVPPSDKKPAHFIHYSQQMEIPGDQIRTTIKMGCDDNAGSLWFMTENQGLLRYIKSQDIFRRYKIHPDAKAHNCLITVMKMDPGGVLWIGTEAGPARFDPLHDYFFWYRQAPANLVLDIEFGKNGTVWFVMEEKDGNRYMSRLDRNTDNFQIFSSMDQNSNGLSSSKLNSSLVDKNGILWISTGGNGIYRYDPGKYKFKSLFTELRPGMKMPWEKILSLCVGQEDCLWMGSDGNGLFSYNRTSGKIRSFPVGDTGELAPKSKRIYSILEHPEGILWIGGDSGLSRLDISTMKFEHYWPDPLKKSYFGPNYIRDIAPGSADNLWIASMKGGLFSFDIQSRSFSFHGASQENPGGVPLLGLMCVLEDSRGKIWTGSLGGLYSYTPGTSENASFHTRYHHNPKDPKSISADMVGDLLFDNNGSLWVATGGGGLNKLDTASGVFKRYTSKEGLISNTITQLWMDNNGSLWLGSYSGLGKFDPDTECCFIYDRSDGLYSREIEQGSGCVSPMGELFFSGQGNIHYFNPSDLNNYTPTVHITKILLYEDPVELNAAGKLELRQNENFLSFKFAALNFTNNHKNQYRYCMIGLDPDTVIAGTRRTASYSDIKPGKYTFWVTGSNNNGIWNPDGTSLDIVIHPPWFGSTLAIFIYVLLFISAIYGFLRWRTWKFRKDRKVLEEKVRKRTRLIEEKDRHILEMDQMKTRFFTNISHEFRTPLSLIIGHTDELMTGKEEDDPELKQLKVIQRNSVRLLSLVSQLLDISKLDSGKLKVELVEADVLRALRLTCASFISQAEKKRIRYKYYLPEGDYLCYFDSLKLDSILINLLSNAFKYTSPEGSIECRIIIDKSQPGLKLTVRDNGPGIDPAKQSRVFDRFYQGTTGQLSEEGGVGIGLSLTKELVELLKGNISLSSVPGEGSSFLVDIPLGKAHLDESEYLIKEEDEKQSVLNEKLETEAASEYPHNGPFHLLIVEDNDDLRFYLKEQMEKMYSVLLASNGESGLKQALKYVPDLIITDVMMPGMGGMELCRLIKTNKRTSHIPVIMLTAKADFESKLSGLEVGADDYMLKPFQIQELRVRTENLIRQRNILRSRFSVSRDNILEDINLNSLELNFIRRLTEIIDNQLGDLDFNVRTLQEKTGMSQVQLYRKLMALTGLSPSKFIRQLRLRKAAKLLNQNQASITQVSLQVGFGNLSYFIKCFREQYGISPSEYSKQFT